MPSNGLYLPDGSFMRFADSRKSLPKELAVRSRSLDFASLGNLYLPNPDPVLKAQGKDIKVYQDLITDDRVGGSIVNRVNATLALNWDIGDGKGRTSRRGKFIKEVFSALPLNTITEQIIRGARGFGYCPIETVWARRGDGLNAPVAVIPKPQEWFVFGNENDLRFLSRDSLFTGEELPPRRFLCPTNESTYINPYGLGLNSRCFWPVTFKRGGWRFWIYFAEKYGAVWPIGKLPRTADPKDVDDLLDVLERMIQDGLAVIPDDGSVDLKESGSKGATSALYKDIIAESNSAISTTWLGHAGAGQSVGGKLGGEELAIEVRKDLRDADKSLVEEVFNTLIDWIYIENWGTAEGAERFSYWEEEDVDKDQAERDDKLSGALEKSGLKFSKGYFVRAYNLEETDLEVKQPETDPIPPAFSDPSRSARFTHASGCPCCAGAAFAEGGQSSDAADVVATRLAQEAAPVTDAMIEQVRQLVESASSLQEIKDKLFDLYGDIDPEALGALMMEAMMTGHLAGRGEVIDGD
jgi:phage gp29-like protein